MRILWDDMQTVLAVVQGRSLATAATTLGLNYTTVARRIARAEDALGLPLFERMADGYHPTETALLVAEHAGPMATAEDALLRRLQGQDQTLKGDFTLTAPQLLIAHTLGPVLDAFCTANPKVNLRVRATNDLLNLNRREADLAVRISRDPGDSLMGVRLTDQHSASFATQDWADRIAADPEATIDWIVYEAYNVVPQAVGATWPNHRVRIVFDDMVAIQGAAQSGLGVARMPLFLGRTTAGLVQVPVLPPQPYAEIWAVAHRDVWPAAKVAAFRKMLVAHFRETRGSYVA